MGLPYQYWSFVRILYPAIYLHYRVESIFKHTYDFSTIMKTQHNFFTPSIWYDDMISIIQFTVFQRETTINRQMKTALKFYISVEMPITAYGVKMKTRKNLGQCEVIWGPSVGQFISNDNYIVVTDWTIDFGCRKDAHCDTRVGITTIVQRLLEFRRCLKQSELRQNSSRK